MTTPLLLLPGMMCDHRLWRHQVDALSAGGERLIQIGDLSSSDTVARLAESVLSQAPQRFALAGLSMGGIVALEIWRQAPDRVERLALLDSNYKSDPPERRLLRDEHVRRVRDGELAEILRDELKPNYLAASHRGDLELLDEVLAMGLDLGPEVFTRQSLALRDRPDSTATLPGIDCPCLVLCGDEDLLCPPERHEEMQRAIPGAQLVIVPQCGHLSTMEQPDAVNLALAHWLSDQQ